MTKPKPNPNPDVVRELVKRTLPARRKTVLDGARPVVENSFETFSEMLKLLIISHGCCNVSWLLKEMIQGLSWLQI